MQFDLNRSIEILSRTPFVIEALLNGISEEWLMTNEGENTWSPFDIVGHLIHGERTDWITRMAIILSEADNKSFTPFDRFAQFEESKGKNITQLLDEFKTVRKQNIEILKSKKINAKDLTKKGIHPAFGEVTLEELLATWTTHDLGHIAQIARVMAKQYTNEVGPWKQYLPILEK
ncbi:DinB family protein [Ferruginibacter sp. SUN002]|uniref:DinB family protein n=1 Tax=Ferruginibacter sp. SUN002 TaxID=2937789 RepID=UPI003D368248